MHLDWDERKAKGMVTQYISSKSPHCNITNGMARSRKRKVILFTLSREILHPIMVEVTNNDYIVDMPVHLK